MPTRTLTTETELDESVGGCWGSPANAGTANAHRSAAANRRLFIADSPFSKMDERDSIEPTPSNPEPLFVQFWQLHTAGEPRKALEICDRILEVIDPADFESHVRQANARGIALCELKRFHESYTVHLAARPLLRDVSARVQADNFHGLGLALKWIGEHARAYRALSDALAIYREAGEPERAARTSVNIARLYVAADRPGLARQLLDTLETSADVLTARAMAYEKEGDKVSARRSIYAALSLLSDSENRATRKEALCVMGRIEGCTT